MQWLEVLHAAHVCARALQAELGMEAQVPAGVNGSTCAGALALSVASWCVAAFGCGSGSGGGRGRVFMPEAIQVLHG